MRFLKKTLIISLLIILCGIMQSAWSSQAPTLSDLSTPSTAKFLPLESAFSLSVEKTAYNQVTLDWYIAPEYYLYQEKLKINIVSQQNKSFKKTLNITELVKPSRIIQDPFFGEQAIYESSLTLDIPIEANWLQSNQTVVFEISSQGCAAKGLCYPPHTKHYYAIVKNNQISHISETNPQSSVSSAAETPALSPQPQSPNFLSSSSLFDGSLLKSLATFYLLGMLLSFTPCVLPMLPILSSVLVGQKNLNAKKAFLLSLCYTLSLSMMLALIGSLAVLMGKNFQALFQQAWIIILFASLFTYLGLVQLGMIHLSLPSSLHNKVHQIQSRFPAGSYLNAIMMGALAILIASPCVSAPLVGALSYISQTGDYILGSGALFMLGLGMGTLLTFAGTLGGRYIPKAGNWMHVINKIFAALFFALSVWLLGRVIPEWIAAGLWVVWSFVVAFMLGTFSSWRQLSKDIGMIFFIYGCLLVISIMQGESHPLQPLRGIFTSSQTQAKLQFDKIDSINALQTKIQHKAEKHAIVKVTADWCTACEHNERTIFLQPEAQAKLNNWSLYKIDVTQMNSDKEKLLSLLKIYGPPVILFYDQNGQEQTEHRIVGKGQLPQFLATINKVCDSNQNVC